MKSFKNIQEKNDDAVDHKIDKHFVVKVIKNFSNKMSNKKWRNTFSKLSINNTGLKEKKLILPIAKLRFVKNNTPEIVLNISIYISLSNPDGISKTITDLMDVQIKKWTFMLEFYDIKKFPMIKGRLAQLKASYKYMEKNFNKNCEKLSKDIDSYFIDNKDSYLKTIRSNNMQKNNQMDISESIFLEPDMQKWLDASDRVQGFGKYSKENKNIKSDNYKQGNQEILREELPSGSVNRAALPQNAPPATNAPNNMSPTPGHPTTPAPAQNQGIKPTQSARFYQRAAIRKDKNAMNAIQSNPALASVFKYFNTSE